MDNDAKAMAQKELMRRSAMKELERRKAAPQQAAPAQDMSFMVPTMEGMKKGAYNLYQTADDLVRGAANGLTFGMADRFAGMMGDGTESERAKSAQAQERSPIAYTGGEIGGSIAGIGKITSMGGTASRFIPQGLSGGKALLAKMLAGGVDGAAINTAMNTGNGRDLNENLGLSTALGGGAVPVGQVIAGLGSKALGAFNKAPSVMKPNEVGPAAQKAYEAADNAQGVFAAKDFSERLSLIKQKLADDAYLPGNQKGVKAALKELDRIDGQNITFKGLEAIRRKVKGGYDPMKKDNNRMLYGIVDELDDLAAKSGSGLYPEARSLYAKKSKIEDLQTAMRRGEDRAKITGMGGNTDNAIRQRIDKVATNMRGATPDEQAALKNAAYGTTSRNVMRGIGRASPTTGALGMNVHTLLQGGGIATGLTPITAAFTGATMGAKYLADRGTKKAVQDAIELIAAGGNKAAMKAPKNATQKAIEAKKDLIAKMLLGGGLTMLPAN